MTPSGGSHPHFATERDEMINLLEYGRRAVREKEKEKDSIVDPADVTDEHIRIIRSYLIRENQSNQWSRNPDHEKTKTSPPQTRKQDTGHALRLCVRHPDLSGWGIGHDSGDALGYGGGHGIGSGVGLPLGSPAVRGRCVSNNIQVC